MTPPAVCLVNDQRTYNAGYRRRTVAELDTDLVVACRRLGQFSIEWVATGFVPSSDLHDVDCMVTGLHSLLTALRAQGGTDAA